MYAASEIKGNEKKNVYNILCTARVMDGLGMVLFIKRWLKCPDSRNFITIPITVLSGK